MCIILGNDGWNHANQTINHDLVWLNLQLIDLMQSYFDDAATQVWSNNE